MAKSLNPLRANKEMNEKRKIIIPTGADPGENLPTPHFDAEATLTARPVIPLADQETSRMHYGDYAGHVTRPFWKRPALLALIVLVAVGVGVAAGLAIGMYRNRQAAQTPVATTPPAPVESPNAGQIVEQSSTPQTRGSVPENTEKPAETPKPAPTSVEPKDEERERTARNEQKRDEQVTPPVVRDKKQDKAEKSNDDEVVDDRQAERERRREERRERRRSQRADEETIDIPRGIERAQKEVNRIRDIFEGRQP